MGGLKAREAGRVRVAAGVAGRDIDTTTGNVRLRNIHAGADTLPDCSL